jgi:hypothetical protein
VSFTQIEIIEEFAEHQRFVEQLVFDFQSERVACRAELHVDHQREYENRIKLQGGDRLTDHRAGGARRAATYYQRVKAAGGAQLEARRRRARECMARLRARKGTAR